MTTNTQVETIISTYRKEVESAQTAFFQIQMIQKLAFSSENDIDKHYKIIDYAFLLDGHLAKINESLNRLENITYTTN